MNKTSLLILHNLKKSKGQYISFGIIICLTALIMNISLVLAFQTFNAYDDLFTELNTADINLLIPMFQDNDELVEDLEKIDGVSSAERHEGVFLSTTVREFADSDFDMNTVFYNMAEERTVNLLRVPADLTYGENIVYLPLYMSDLGGFSKDSSITYSTDQADYTFTIGGIISEMQYGNYGTGIIGAYLSDAAYQKFSEEQSENVVAEYSLKTTDGAVLTEIKNQITDLFNEKNIAVLNMGDRETSKQARTMVCSLLIVIFLALSAIILAVSIFLNNFRIRSSVEDEMTDMGVLKALGYTSSMIIASIVMPYTLVGVLSAVIGTALSYSALPTIAYILAVQSGYSYTPVFDLTALLIAVLIPTLTILLFSYLTARKIRRLEPINAIRNIIGNTAEKNHFPLETSKAGIKFTLVLKQIASAAGQNILLFAVSFGIMILLAFAGTLLYNVSIKPDHFMKTLSEESPSVIFTAQMDRLTELKDILTNDGQVALVLEYATTAVSYADGSLKAFVCEDFSRITNDICYEGRNPVSADEIAVGNALSDQYAIGNGIEITIGGVSHTYTITGYIQSVNNNGTVCELTKEGFEKISDDGINTLNVYLNSGSAEDFITAYEETHDELIASSVNYEQLAKNGEKMYAGIVSAVTFVLFIISVLIVLLVMYIIINSMISRRRQEFGIYKAIGYSNRQLTLQTAFSFVPVVALSAALSAVLGLWYMPAINNAILGMIGAIKNHFVVPLWILLAFAALLTVTAFVISLLLAAPVKKITAYSLLKE